METKKDLRLELYAELLDFPLLKFRIYELHKNLKSTETIKKVLDRHKVKVNWHLRRIYRTRGLIIHSGDVPSYTSTLIENLHNYLDIFLTKIIDLATSKSIRTIEQGVLEIQLTEQFQYSILEKHKGEPISDINYKECLFA